MELRGEATDYAVHETGDSGSGNANHTLFTSSQND